MDTIQEKRLDEQGLKLHFIQTKKFKTINIIVKLKSKLDKETITKRALLPYILKQGTKTYPDRSALQLKLDDLYGAVLTADGGKKEKIILSPFALSLQTKNLFRMHQT